MGTFKTFASTLSLAALVVAGPISAAPAQDGSQARNPAENAQPTQGRPAQDQKMANRPDIRSGESVEDEMEEVGKDDEQSGLGGVATGEEPVSHPSGRRSD